MMKPIYDAHAHLGTEEERKIRKDQGIITLYSASTKEEWEQICRMKREEDVPASLGVHPWNGEKTEISQLEPYFHQAQAIGEIGMDSLWCSVPLDIQEKVFRSQLKIASEKHMPVILHTKDQEKRISAIIKEFPNRYMVHWYSNEKGEGFSDFLEEGCYFTVGPDGETNPAVQRVIKEVPLNRLLIETDGWPAVCWALGEVPLEKLRETLERSILLIAKKKNRNVTAVESQLEENFTEFLTNLRTRMNV